VERATTLGYPAIGLTDHNTIGGATRFVEAAGRCNIRPILGSRLSHNGESVTALLAEPSGYHSLCRLITRIHTTKPPDFAVLSESAEGLHLLVDDPALFKPPLTDTYRGRLWAEVVRPGVKSARERTLLDAASRVGARPVASLTPYFCEPAGHAIHKLLSTVRQGGMADAADKVRNVTPGTGFPKVFYLKYHLYAHYFPLMALARARRAGSL
jgi:DNA polymerase III alpha subunit